MKFIALTLTAALALSTPAKASDTQTKSFCPTLGLWAEAVMMARQSGMLMSEVLATVTDEKMTEIVVVLANAAFEHPRYDTPEIKRRVIADFQADQEAACYKFASKN